MRLSSRVPSPRGARAYADTAGMALSRYDACMRTGFLLQGKGDRPTAGVLSMAPGEGWRDHWRQNICVLDAPICVRQGDVVCVRACHDDWRIWFQVCTQVRRNGFDACAEPPTPPPPPEAPAEMGLQRVLFGGHTLRLLADEEHAATYVRAIAAGLRDVAPSDGNSPPLCLTMGDGHWLALAAAAAGPSAVRVVDMEASQQALYLATTCFAAARLPPSHVRAVLVGKSEGWRWASGAHGSRVVEEGSSCAHLPTYLARRRSKRAGAGVRRLGGSARLRRRCLHAGRRACRRQRER